MCELMRMLCQHPCHAACILSFYLQERESTKWVRREVEIDMKFLFDDYGNIIMH